MYIYAADLFTRSHPVTLGRSGLTTKDVAKRAGVHRDTLLRWLREGRVPEPSRDRHGWRMFTEAEAAAVVSYAQDEKSPLPLAVRESTTPYSPAQRLAGLDWDFADAHTSYLTHSLHPYPARYIPQIPNALIQELSSVGETVFDPFCGSGTTLVEALLLKRHAIGLDANPLACLITRAKTHRMAAEDLRELLDLAAHAQALSDDRGLGTLPLFPQEFTSTPPAAGPGFDGIDAWFDTHVIHELRILKSMCAALQTGRARDVALTCFSSIIVSVSRQDSDTRYVRRQKGIEPGETFQRFSLALQNAVQRCAEFSDLAESRYTCRVIHDDALSAPDAGSYDLVVCSPPYPNAYSYHLYHRTRMLWLDMDQPRFKQAEIGSHRKYSRKSKTAATLETFRSELFQVLSWLLKGLRNHGFACFVIGDSTLKGVVVHNDQVLIETATDLGYTLEANHIRNLQDSKKSFNPAIGRIKKEHIVILRKRVS